MARAIDANELMVEIQVCSWDSEQDKERAEDLVLGMPTLTPPPAGGREEQWMNILHRIIKLLELLSKEKSENFIHLPC